MAQTLYINPTTGSDSASGTQTAPFKTITNALKQAQADTTIQLSPGTYSSSSGEVFPLQVPSRVKILGNEANKGNGILIQGSGSFSSPTEALQNITFLLNNNAAELRGVTVTNLGSRGTGAWLESSNATVANCTFTKCKREGIFATGTANPSILNNTCIENDGNGISIARNSTGIVQGNICTKAGSGISIDGNATPRVINNQIRENRDGMIISVNAQPILRNNLIENNTSSGISVTGKAFPDLGSTSDPGGNTIRNNGQFDLANFTNPLLVLISVGNALIPSKVKGQVKIDGSIDPGDNTPPGGGGVDPGDNTPPGGGGVDPDGGNVDPGNNTPPTLSDIKGHWAETFIQNLFDKRLISGFSDGTFKPDAKMNRAQYAALLIKAFNPAPKRNGLPFNDVADNFWAKDVIQQAYRSQFISGFPNNIFRPNDNVQRVQVLVSLVSGLTLGSSDLANLLTYDDRSQIPDYAKDKIATATARGFVVNYPKLRQLNPNQDATRAEVTAMVYQALVDAKQVSAINSPYIVSANTGGNTPTLAFTDISGHWAAEFINALAQQGLISGFSDGTFKPDQLINRGQYAALLVKALNPTPKRDAIQFSDVTANFWAKDVIGQAYRSQFITGYPDNTFRPNANMQRVQVVVSLVSGLGLSSSDMGVLSIYDDRNTIPDYARDEVATATTKKIVVTYPNLKQFNPNRDATRAEVVAMIYQALVNAKQVSAINSPYIVSA
ncbi:MAG: S-layer homology domain-containing protein [Coleofasciculaceae cyanobacterium]